MKLPIFIVITLLITAFSGIQLSIAHNYLIKKQKKKRGQVRRF
jgi:hypothetical protein